MHPNNFQRKGNTNILFELKQRFKMQEYQQQLKKCSGFINSMLINSKNFI